MLPILLSLIRRQLPATGAPSPHAGPSSSSTASSALCATAVYASQEEASGSAAAPSMISYSYTDRPWKLVAYDVYHFFRLAWALPYIVWPVRAAASSPPTSSGAMAEISCTPMNMWCVAVHTVLAVVQLGFVLVVVPVTAATLPAWAWAGLMVAFLGANRVACGVLLNGGFRRRGGGGLYHSDPRYARARPEHAHEQWVFLNGVAVGRHWMQSNVDRLALTFGRPIVGVHNRTNGLVFDVLECLVQRNFAYATQDVRTCYGVLKKTLHRADIRRVVFVLHSQGGIEGGLVLDWLLQELPQHLLAKLEVYTFGNAANHFHNPHRGLCARPGAPGNKDKDKAIRHIEHYAHTTDFVALWGVLHFVTTVPQTRMIPRFQGCVFAHTPAAAATARGGHQFVQHYLDGMFPLARDAQTGAFTGCAETGNTFMESDVVVGPDGDERAVVQRAYARSWAGGVFRGAAGTVNADESTKKKRRRGPAAEARRRERERAAEAEAAAAAAVEVHAASPILTRQPSRPRPIKVKDISRLWQYRNGGSPEE